MIQPGIIGRRADDESLIAEDITEDIAVMGLRDIIHHDILHAGLTGSTGNDLRHALRIAIHRAVADDESRLRLILRELVVDADDLVDILMPHGAVGRAEIIDLNLAELLQRILYGDAILADDIAVVAHHLQPEFIGVDVAVDNTTVEGTKATESITGEEHVGRRVERHHRLRPVDHRRHEELQRVLAEVEGVALLHIDGVIADLIEALQHVEGLLVADDLHVGIVFLQQRDTATVVGLHVVDHEVVDLAVTDHGMEMLEKLHEEVHLHRINETDFLIIDEIRVVRHAIGQRPQAFEEVLVAVVDTYIMNIFCYFHNSLLIQL